MYLCISIYFCQGQILRCIMLHQRFFVYSILDTFEIKYFKLKYKNEELFHLIKVPRSYKTFQHNMEYK